MATRILAWLVNTFWGVIAASVIIVALFVSLGRYYLPLVDSFRSDFEKQIGTLLSAEVHVDRLIGDWQGFNPIIGVERLTVSAKIQADTAPSVVMSVSDARLEVDMLGSLLALTPVYREALIVGLQFHFYKTENGGWASPLFKGGGGVDVADLYEAAHDLRVVGTQLIFHDATQVNVVSVANVSLERGQNLTQSMLRIIDGANSTPLDIVVETRGRVGSTGFSLAAYLEVESIDLSPYRFLSNDFVRSDRASLSLWAQWRTGEAFRIHGKAFADTLSVGTSFAVKEAHANVGLSFDDGRWTFFSEHVVFDNDDTPMQLPDFRLDIDRGLSSAKLSIEQIDLAQISESLPLLPASLEAASAALQVLRPRGQLRNVALRVVRKGGRWVPSLLADVVDVRVDSWRGAPAFSGIDGQLQHQDRFGWFSGHQTNMTMVVPKLYADPFELRDVDGRIGWYLGEQITIASEGLRGDSSYGRFDAGFTVDINDPSAVQKVIPTLSLTLNIQEASAAAVAQMVPDLPATRETKRWLEEGSLQGEIHAAKTILNTSISQSKQWFPAIQILVDADYASLSVGSDWPRVNTFDSTVLMSHRQLGSISTKARLLDIDVSNLVVDVDIRPDATAVNFSGSGMGPVQSSLALFQQTPLADVISHGADGWTGEGDFSAGVAVGFVLESLPQVVADVQFSLIDSSFSLVDADLTFEHVQGQIDYGRGALSSQQLVADVFGKPWRAELSTGPNNKIYYLSALGDIEMRSIADWLEQPLLLFAKGETAAAAKLTIHENQAPTLALHSDLKGVAITLPEPFRKLTSAPLPIDILLSLGVDMDLTVRSEFVQFDAHIGDQLRGSVGLGHQADLMPMPKQGVLVTGHIKQLMGDDATRLLDDYLRLAEVYPSAEEELLIQIKDFSLERVLLGDEFIQAATVDAHNEGEEWFVEFRSDAVKATVHWREEAPLVVAAEHLRYPFTALAEEEIDTDVSPWRPSDLVAVNISVESFEFEGEDYGSWSFNIRPTAEGVIFDDISGLFKGMTLAGATEKTPASLLWIDGGEGEDRSEFQGQLGVSNVKTIFEAYSLEPMLTSKRAIAAVNVSWPSEPFNVDHLVMSGTVDFRLSDGQFLRTEGAPTGLLKLLGVFNFDNLVRRMRLDFGDLVHEGLSYDRFEASLVLVPGVVTINKPLTVEGPSSDFRMTGALDLVAQTIDGELVAVVPVSKNLPWLAALAGGLPAAAGVYLASKVFSDSFDRFSSASYSILGPWAEPEIKFERLFDELKDAPVNEARPTLVE